MIANCGFCEKEITHDYSERPKVIYCSDCWHSDLGRKVLSKALGYSLDSGYFCRGYGCRSTMCWYGGQGDKVKAAPKKSQLCPQCEEVHL